MTAFIPGIKLNEAFYWQCVRPILDETFPGLAHSADYIGWGSDVLGFDTPVSMDHGWGLRFCLFLDPDGFESNLTAVDGALRQKLPVQFQGFSTHWSRPDPNDSGVRHVRDIEHGPVDHYIQIDTIPGYWQSTIGADAYGEPAPADWLTFKEQDLLSVTAGKVYHDGLGLESVRQRFAYYPREVWLYLMASEWALISQEEAFAGRTVSVGDDLGSRLITGRLVERLMRLCFLYEKRYTPYSKWFGSAFKMLRCYPKMGPLLEGALDSAAYPGRERYLAGAYTLAVDLLNELAIAPPIDSRTRTYSAWHALASGIPDLALDDPGNTRPHQVIFAGRIVAAIYSAIHDPAVLGLIPHIGSVSQFMTPSSDALQNIRFCRSLAQHLKQS